MGYSPYGTVPCATLGLSQGVALRAGTNYNGWMLPAVRLSQVAVETVSKDLGRIRSFVRMESPALMTACRQYGLPIELAEACSGLLASVVDDLIAIGQLRRTDFERSKRKERILAAAEEPYASALRLAMACSPINGRAAVAHWDAICEKHELGKLAFLLGMPTELAYKYGRKLERRGL